MIFFLTSEIFPFSKSGGLADVAGILPLALRDLGMSVSVVTPYYGSLNISDHQLSPFLENCPVGYPWPEVGADIYAADYKGVEVYFVDRPEYFDRKRLYCTPHGEFFDNCERFIFFSRAFLSLARRLQYIPRIVHCNDWHTSIVPAYIHYNRQEESFWSEAASVLTIHNLAFQGQYSARLFWEAGLPWQAWHMEGAEYYGSFNMLKTGIAFADKITTVSPSYAQEIMTSEFGEGLEGILSKRSEDVCGILNGVDYSIWDPGNDPFIPANYSLLDMLGKRTCKETLLQEMDLDPEMLSRPVMGFIGRLQEQKGVDLLLQCLANLLELNVALVVLGEGSREAEKSLFRWKERYPGRVAVTIGYTERLSHEIMAGADLFLMPSRYEPCGLTQLYSLRYGTIPVTSDVGGLRDTIVPYPDPDCTGFKFGSFTSDAFYQAVRTAVEMWQEGETWKNMQQRGMRQDFSWIRSAQEYAALYEELQRR